MYQGGGLGFGSILGGNGQLRFVIPIRESFIILFTVSSNSKFAASNWIPITSALKSVTGRYPSEFTSIVSDNLQILYVQ